VTAALGACLETLFDSFDTCFGDDGGVNRGAAPGLCFNGGCGAGLGSSNDLLGVRGGVGPKCSDTFFGDWEFTKPGDRRTGDGVGTGGARLFRSSKLDLPFRFDNDRALFSFSAVFVGDAGGGIERSTSPERLSNVFEVRGVDFIDWFLDGTLDDPLDEEL
jgi:hypothetical protein